MRVPHRAVRDWPEDERPRERLLRHGPQYLGDAELMAIILRTGTRGRSAVDVARSLLERLGGLHKIAEAHPTELSGLQEGLGPAKAAELLAAFELGRRAERASPRQVTQLTNPQEVAAFLSDEMRYLGQEEVRVVLLNTRNQVLSQHTICKGSVATAQFRMADLFKPAVREDAVAMIMAHNHPSGDPTPSGADVSLTMEAIKAAEVMGIDLLDHVIIGRPGWLSMKQRRMAFG